MNVTSPTTCEECLSLLTGVAIPKSSSKLDTNYTLKTPDVAILSSIARQLSKGIAMTDRQYQLVKTKLLEYSDQYTSNNIDVETVCQNLMYPLRVIDRSHWIKVLRYKDEDILGIRFPFNKKVIQHVESLRKLQPSEVKYEDNTHFFPMSAKNIFTLVEIANRFESKFVIHDSILEIYKQLRIYEDNKQDYLPGIFDLKIKNIPQEAIKYLENDIGLLSTDNLDLYFDRRKLYGIHYFPNAELEKSINKHTILSQQIIKREHSTHIVNNEVYSFNELTSSINDLKRFPILFVLDEKNAYDQLVTTFNSLYNFIDTSQISVMFRLDGSSNPFNEYIKEKKINNSVDKNTKVVYISNNKLPKPLLSADWRANCVISYNAGRTRAVREYLDQFDLHLIYDNSSNIGYWNRTLRKYIRG